MSTFKLKSNPQVKAVFDNYPEHVRDKMNQLRALVIKTAEETSSVTGLEETLKWGEPSYKTKNGSTLRMDWKAKTPGQYAMFFQCSSRLVETFRIVFEDEFKFEGKRAIIFDLNQELPVEQLKECIKATLTYHDVKHLMTLGI
tara:strand:- start:262 stop:690 length:429 start_codon:yes stop_codon:yes gene_type:complete